MNWNINSCDGIYNSFDVHFTSECDNRCPHCIDAQYSGKGINHPDAHAIAKAIIDHQEGFDDVLFLGGEPCLYLPELCDCIRMIKQETRLKCYVTTSVPHTCYRLSPKFLEMAELADGVNLSVQHYREDVADKIRCTTSRYDRQAFYRELPHKERFRIHLNLVRPYLCDRDDVLSCLQHYDDMGFPVIKLSELQRATNSYASFEQIMGIRLPSPFAHGCQTWFDMRQLLPEYKGRLLLKRSCFLNEETRRASLADGIKVLRKCLVRPRPQHYAVVYEDGSLSNGWV